MFRARLASPLLVAALGACVAPPNPITADEALAYPTTSPEKRISLSTKHLKTQTDFDEFERDFRDRRGSIGLTTLVALYEALAEAADPASRPEDALLLMRLGVLYAGLDDHKNGMLQKALAVGGRLRELAPNDPNTLFFQGYIPFVAFGGRPDRPLIVTADTAPFAAACAAQWRALLAASPGYAGPSRYDHAFLEATVTRLEAATALQAKSAAVPSPEVAPEGGAEAAVPVAASPSVVREVSADERAALATLDRFQTAQEGDRVGICRDWKASRVEGERPESLLRMDLTCAIQTRDASGALGLIERLGRVEGAAWDRCLWLGRLVDRVPDAASAVRAAGGEACGAL